MKEGFMDEGAQRRKDHEKLEEERGTISKTKVQKMKAGFRNEENARQPFQKEIRHEGRNQTYQVGQWVEALRPMKLVSGWDLGLGLLLDHRACRQDGEIPGFQGSWSSRRIQISH